MEPPIIYSAKRKTMARFTTQQLEILKDPTINTWLTEFDSKPATKRQYESRIIRFLEATKTSVQDFNKMDAKDIKKLFLAYQAAEVEKGKKNNGVLSVITAMRSYLITLDKRVDFRKGQLVNLEADTDSHIFTNGDLKLLFDVGDTFEKALLATAVSEGWEISAFLEQDREVIDNRLAHATQNNEKYIYFSNTRKKTGVSRFCVLNPLAIEWLTKYQAMRKDVDDPRLFPITADGAQKMLYRLAEQAGLKRTGSLRFHNIRKWLMSRLSRCGFNEFQIKYLMGKSIGLSDSTYLQTLQVEIEEKYPLVYGDYLNICPVIGVKETNLQLDELKTKIDAKDKIVDALVQDVTKKDKELEALKERMLKLENVSKPALETLLKRLDELEKQVKK
jgi:integrase